MYVIECLADKYFANRNDVFYIVNIIFWFVVVYGVLLSDNKMKYSIYRICINILNTLAVSFMGLVIYLLGIAPEIKYKYFNILFFISSTIVVSLYYVLQSIICLNLRPLLQMCRYIQYIIFFELFLLAITYRWEMQEWIAGTLAVSGFETIYIFWCDRENKPKENVSIVYDYPNPDLYPTRKKQLDNFIRILKQQTLEPYAIMISGKWGSGKSSFVMALEKKMPEACFIRIQAGSEKNVSQTIADISEQIIGVLKKNSIYIEREDSIEKYFLAFTDILVDVGWGKFLSKIKKNKYVDVKDYVNSKLKELKKTIYLVIDDLDRCDNEYQSKMFKVIRESTELVNCKTIFLVDKEMFLNNEKNDIRFIEKYISYTLDLCKVDYDEIVNFFINDIFDDNFIQGMSPIFIKNRSIKKIREEIIDFPIIILEKLDKEILRISEKQGNEESENYEMIQKTIEEIKINTLISRKVKNYLKGIKIDIENLNKEIESCSLEFSKENWLQGIIEIQFIKNFLQEKFYNIQHNQSISSYMEKNKDNSLEVILGLATNSWGRKEKKEYILNQIIYKIDVIDFDKVLTQREEYLDILRNKMLNISNINEYLIYAETWEDLNQILDICMKREYQKIIDREKFIEKLLDVLTERRDLFETDINSFKEFTDKLINKYLVKNELSEIEKQICIRKGGKIADNIILTNLHFFTNILSIIFPIEKVVETMEYISFEEVSVQESGVEQIDNLYNKLRKLDSDHVYQHCESEKNHLTGIEQYFTSFQRDLTNTKIGIDLEKIFENINIVINICKLWTGLEEHLKVSEEENINETFKHYFLNTDYAYREIVFYSQSELLNALCILKKFYELHQKDYIPNYSLYLYNVVRDMVILFETKPEWYKDTVGELTELLKELLNKVCKLDADSKNITDMIYIYIYRFCKYCGNDI